MGDTNCDLKVNDNYDNYYNNHSITLLRINAIYGLTQIIKVKARITEIIAHLLITLLLTHQIKSLFRESYIWALVTIV
jgi:hypothetical protein